METFTRNPLLVLIGKVWANGLPARLGSGGSSWLGFFCLCI